MLYRIERKSSSYFCYWKRYGSFVWMKRGGTLLNNKLDLEKWTARVLDKCNQRTRTLNSMCKFRWFLYFPLYVISDAQSAKVVFNANVRLSRLMNRNWWYDAAHLRRQRHFPALPKAWLRLRCCHCCCLMTPATIASFGRTDVLFFR